MNAPQESAPTPCRSIAQGSGAPSGLVTGDCDLELDERAHAADS